MSDTHDPLQPHSHEPNPAPPTTDPTMKVTMPNGRIQPFSPDDLHQLPYTAVANCYIVSTGHGTSGPFTFGGVTLLDFVRQLEPSDDWQTVAVISADGFGNRVYRHELEAETRRPILLAYNLDDSLMSRQQGLVRLIVPSETEDALRQVKWVEHLKIS